MQKPAIILLSGGLDSITVLAMAQQQGFVCHALSFDYGQRHRAELTAAQQIAKQYNVASHRIIPLGLGNIGGSALTDATIAVPDAPQTGIPVTYVPARNTVFLAFALGLAEVLQAYDIFIGVNAIDYSGYPDCRPEFIAAFSQLANLATKASVEGATFTIHTPLIQLSKAEIIQRGVVLGVDYQHTVSCYAADEDGKACGHCDACRLRQAGFLAAGVLDPTRYQ
jgi:7-cyano-7-deazaguanine synthase